MKSSLFVGTNVRGFLGKPLPTNLYTSICLIIIRNIPILLPTKLRPYEPETFLLSNDSTVFYEDWCVRYLVNSNKYWNSGVIFIDDSFSFWSFFNAYIMLIRLDVTMAKRKSLIYIFGKQCNESAEIQRHIITEDIYWCALNVSRLSNRKILSPDEKHINGIVDVRNYILINQY